MAKSGYSVRCKNCGARLNSKDAYWLFLDIDKKIYCCNKECADNYLLKLNKVKEEKDKWDTLYKFVKLDVLKYKAEQRLPKHLITRLVDIRNGTTVEKYVGRVELSKEGYPYEVILKTFQKCNDDIQQSFRIKNFDNERQQINYMMAIIENNLNDIYNGYLREIELSKVEEKPNHILEIIEFEENNQLEIPKANTKDERDLTTFFSDWQ